MILLFLKKVSVFIYFYGILFHLYPKNRFNWEIFLCNDFFLQKTSKQNNLHYVSFLFIYLEVFRNIFFDKYFNHTFLFQYSDVKLYKLPTLMFFEQKIKRWIFPEKGLQTQSFWSQPLIKEEICMFLRVANFYFKDIKM